MENNNVILQTKEGIKLTTEQFIYQAKSYPIKNMKRASLKEGNYNSPDKLQIEFSDGSIEEFLLKPTVTFKEVLADRLTTLKLTPMSLMQRKMTAQIFEWASSINELISKTGTEPVQR
jgi:hypothetical protein